MSLNLKFPLSKMVQKLKMTLLRLYKNFLISAKNSFFFKSFVHKLRDNSIPNATFWNDIPPNEAFWRALFDMFWTSKVRLNKFMTKFHKLPVSQMNKSDFWDTNMGKEAFKNTLFQNTIWKQNKDYSCLWAKIM